MQRFTDFSLPEPLQKSLVQMGFETPTPIQAQSIPEALLGKDILASAQTGTGKTAAFCLPMITQLVADNWKSALILVPTRELALQIEVFLRDLTKGLKGLHSVVLIGGQSMSTQKHLLARGPKIIVATPGRLVDHMQQGTVSLKSVAVLVLDEADRMLDMGFAPQIERIVRTIPTERQTMLFSATYPQEIVQISKQYMRSPVRIAVGEVSRPIKAITQTLLQTTQAGKSDLLVDELNKRPGSILIFMRTKHRVDKLMKFLEEYGFSVARIHGNRSQAQRNQALNGFRNGSVKILVATDVASRGIDVDNIQTVINFDLPELAEDYVHRIGRTGRNGLDGEALCFLTPEDADQWAYISGTIEGRKVRKPPVERPAKRGRGGGGSAGPRGPRGGGDRPRSDRPRSDRFASDRPRGDRPQRTERSFGSGRSRDGQIGDTSSSEERNSQTSRTTSATNRPLNRTLSSTSRSSERPVRSESRSDSRSEPRHEKRRDRNSYEKTGSDRVRNARKIGERSYSDSFGNSEEGSRARMPERTGTERKDSGNWGQDRPARPSTQRSGGRFGNGAKSGGGAGRSGPSRGPGGKGGSRPR